MRIVGNLQAVGVPKDSLFMITIVITMVVSGTLLCFYGMSKGGSVELKLWNWSFRFENSTKNDVPDTTDSNENQQQ